MNCWNRFDMRFVLTVPSAVERRRKFLEEAERVGLDVDCYYNPMVPLENLGVRGVPAVRTFFTEPARVSCNIGHYRIVKTAFEAGAESVLVFEDDELFLRDTGKIMEIIEDLPDDYDMALLDSLTPLKIDPRVARANLDANRVSEYWCRVKDSLRSFGGYAFGRRGMKWFLSCNDWPFSGRGRWRLCDTYLNEDLRAPGLNYYVAVPRVSIQYPTAVAMSRDHRPDQFETATARYVALGTDIENYGGRHE